MCVRDGFVGRTYMSDIYAALPFRLSNEGRIICNPYNPAHASNQTTQPSFRRIATTDRTGTEACPCTPPQPPYGVVEKAHREGKGNPPYPPLTGSKPTEEGGFASRCVSRQWLMQTLVHHSRLTPVKGGRGGWFSGRWNDGCRGGSRTATTSPWSGNAGVPLPRAGGSRS